MTIPKVVYVARYSSIVRLILFAMAILFLALMPVFGPVMLQALRSGNWFLGLGGLGVGLLLPLLVLLEVLLRRTIFSEAGIHHRSTFGMTRFISYQHIDELTILPEEALILKIRHGRKLKIHAREGDPEEIIEAMRPFLDPEIRVITV